MDDSLKQQLKDAGYTGEFDLSSLIDACGEHFMELHKYHVSDMEGIFTGEIFWTAYSWVQKSLQADGKTPDIAVARLYLLLNKKDEK